MRRVLAAVVPAGLLAGLLAGCVSPARDEPQYRLKAVTALEAAASAVATGLLAVQQQQQGKIFSAYADEVITGNENTAGSISSGFGNVQPPDHTSDEVRNGVMAQLSAAQDALADARIAVRRKDRHSVRTAAGELRSAAAGLEALRARLR